MDIKLGESRRKGKETEIWGGGKKIKILKNGGGEEYQFEGNFLHPCTGYIFFLAKLALFDL